MRLAAQLVGPAKGVLSSGQVAHTEADLADLVEGLPGCAQVEALQLIAGPRGFFFGLSPSPSKAHDLGVLHPAQTGEARDGLPAAPALGGVGPLGGPAVIGQALAGSDHAAVDNTGGERAELAADGSDHRLVQQGHPFLDLTLGHQHIPLVE